MSWLQVVVLSILQGLTEFLPVSSSGHLVLSREVFGLGGTDDVSFTVIVHLGTLARTSFETVPLSERRFRTFPR